MVSLPHITAISPNRSLLRSFNRPVYTRRHDQRKERTTMSLSSSLTTAKRVVLVRHGQSTWNEEGRIQGSSDFSVLTNKGESQADISRQMLIEDSFDVCFTRFLDLRITFLDRLKNLKVFELFVCFSPLKRSKKTAEIIWGSREAEMIFNYDLREIDLYSFQVSITFFFFFFEYHEVQYLLRSGALNPHVILVSSQRSLELDSLLIFSTLVFCLVINARVYLRKKVNQSLVKPLGNGKKILRTS